MKWSRDHDAHSWTKQRMTLANRNFGLEFGIIEILSSDLVWNLNFDFCDLQKWVKTLTSTAGDYDRWCSFLGCYYTIKFGDPSWHRQPGDDRVFSVAIFWVGLGRKFGADIVGAKMYNQTMLQPACKSYLCAWKVCQVKNLYTYDMWRSLFRCIYNKNSVSLEMWCWMTVSKKNQIQFSKEISQYRAAG